MSNRRRSSCSGSPSLKKIDNRPPNPGLLGEAEPENVCSLSDANPDPMFAQSQGRAPTTAPPTPAASLGIHCCGGHSARPETSAPTTRSPAGSRKYTISGSAHQPTPAASPSPSHSQYAL